jgi:tRNA threonylcarbamoyl adenosine modification protein YeaZ
VVRVNDGSARTLPGVLLLAMDTATAAVTVALHDGVSVLAECHELGPMRHGELLAPSIATVLDRVGASPADLTSMTVGVGPGPFTGLRVGLVTARTLGMTLGIPVQGVCTLDVLAAESGVDGHFVVATDARRKEVYWASYADPATRIEGPRVVRAADVATDLPVVGRGGLLYPESLPNAVGPTEPAAGILATLVASGAVSIVEPEPMYLRRPDVAEPGRPKAVL